MLDQMVILLAEDNNDDVLSVRRALAQFRLINPVYVVSDGAEAIAYLKGEGRFANRSQYPLPELLILDLNMPLMDGFQVLRWVRQHHCLNALRVIVLTASRNTRELNLAYELGANAFLVKPVKADTFLNTIMVMNGYWLWPNSHSNLSQ